MILHAGSGCQYAARFLNRRMNGIAVKYPPSAAGSSGCDLHNSDTPMDSADGVTDDFKDPNVGSVLTENPDFNALFQSNLQRLRALPPEPAWWPGLFRVARGR